jgi:hypothetical protein
MTKAHTTNVRNIAGRTGGVGTNVSQSNYVITFAKKMLKLLFQDLMQN